MKTILCVGEALIDFIGKQAGKSLIEQNLFEKKAGGAPANVAAVIAALGGEARFYGQVGEDPFGEYLNGQLERFGVDTTALLYSSDSTTLAFVSNAAHGERSFDFVPGAGVELSFDELDTLIYETSDAIHFGSAFAFLSDRSTINYLDFLAKCQEDGKFISFDANYRPFFWHGDQPIFRKRLQAFLNAAHLIKLSDEEALIISGEDQLENAIAHLKHDYNAVFAITLGAAGTRIFGEDFDEVVAAPAVEVVDTTGAGDAFIASLLFNIASDDGFANIHDVKKLSQWTAMANHVAANVCRFRGAMGYFSHARD